LTKSNHFKIDNTGILLTVQDKFILITSVIVNFLETFNLEGYKKPHKLYNV